MLVLLLIVSSTFEMVSVLFLFGYLGSFSESGGGVGQISGFFRYIGSGYDGAAYAALTGAFLVAFFALKNAFGLLTNFALMRFAMKRYQEVATRLFGDFLETRLEIFNQRGILGPQQILDSVSIVFRNGFVPALSAISDLTLVATMLAALLFVLDPLLVLALIVLFGSVVTLLHATTRRFLKRLGRLRLEAEASQRQTMLEGFRGLVDIRLSGRQSRMVERFAASVGNFALADRRARALEQLPRALNELLLAMSITLTAVYFSTTPNGLEGALPILAVLGFAGLRIVAATSRFSESLQRMQETEPARETLMSSIEEASLEVRDLRPARAEAQSVTKKRPTAQRDNKQFRDSLKIESVDFCFPGEDEPALSNVTIQIPRGAFVGLCGPSGSGKSTLALVAMGLLEPQSGRVLCDDWDVRDHAEDWHEKIAFVGQSPFIAPRNVRENVAFGQLSEEIDDAKVWDALETAALADVIRSREEGLDAMIGEEGVLLSGGQRQRLSIARALYRDTEVLVFDEATAALDNITEAEISAAISSFRETKTMMVIAHRLSTIRECDQIYYMEDGKVISSGTYEELEEGCPSFRRMARLELTSEPGLKKVDENQVHSIEP